MPGKSRNHTDAVLNVLRGQSLAAATPYVGLFSAAPADDAAAGTEMAGNGYARQAVSFGAPSTDAGNIRQITNPDIVLFGPATPGAWPQAVAFGVFSAATGGSLLYWDALLPPKTVGAGDYGQFDAATLVVKED